jgi:glutathione S-transferase
MERLDFHHGDQLTPEYAKLNPNKKMPTLEDDGFVLSNAILFYLAANNPTRRYGRQISRGRRMSCAGLRGKADIGMRSPLAWFHLRRDRKP